MRMFVIDCGELYLPRNQIINDEIAQNNPDLSMTVPVSCYLVEHPVGWILFDAACDPEGYSKNWPEAFKASPYVVENNMYLPQRLQELGVEPDDIAYVVASHIHLDHGGCLHLFKKAKIFVNETELTTTLETYINGGDLNAHVPSDVQHWIDADLNWEKVSEPTKIINPFENLTIYNFGPGHAWGMLGLLVNLKESGNFLLVSDAIYCRENIGPPIILPGIIFDPEGYVKTMKEIEVIAKKENAEIVCGHDLAQFQNLKKREILT